jgi:hypothetical protein
LARTNQELSVGFPQASLSFHSFHAFLITTFFTPRRRPACLRR